jgi:DNA polymerase III psi subunit
MDTNHDGVINMSDADFKDLQIWIDSNHDGISQASELHSLQSLGVSQLHLNAAQTTVNNNGNWVFLDSTYTATDGTTHQMADVWFEKGGPLDVTAMTTSQVAALTPDQVQMLSTDQIHAMTPDQVAAFSTADVAALTPEQVHTLSTGQIHALTPDQVAAFSTTDIAVLSHDQVQALSLDDVAALQDFGKDDAFSPSQLQAMVKPHLAQGLDDILFSGNVHIHANSIAGSDQLQLIVTGDATGKVELMGQPGDWKDAGSMLVNGAESHVYNNGHTQIVIQGSVTAVEKDFHAG